MMEQAFMEQVAMEPATMEPVVMEPAVMDQASIMGPHGAAQTCVMDHHSPGCRALHNHMVAVTTKPLNTRVLPLVEEAKEEVAWEVDRSEKIFRNISHRGALVASVEPSANEIEGMSVLWRWPC